MNETHYRVGVLIHRWDCAEAEYKLVRSSYPHNSLTKMQADRLHDAVCELEPPCCKFTPAPKSEYERAKDEAAAIAALADLSAPKPSPWPFRAVLKDGVWSYTHFALPGIRIARKRGSNRCIIASGDVEVDRFTIVEKPEDLAFEWPTAGIEAKFAELIAEEAEKPQPEPDAGETFTKSFSQGIWTYRDKRVPDKRIDWNERAELLTIWWCLDTKNAKKHETAKVSKEWVAEMMAYTYLNRWATGKSHF